MIICNKKKQLYLIENEKKTCTEKGQDGNRSKRKGHALLQCFEFITS
jgi:hypothetical protein